MIILKFILPLFIAGIVSGKTANLKQGGSACYPQPDYCMNGGTCYTQYTAQPVPTTTTPCSSPSPTTTTMAPTTTQYIMVTQPVCGCQPQYAGDRCEVPVTAAPTTVATQPECVSPVVTAKPSRCDAINCQNGGTCREISMAPFTLCICQPNYTGNNCQSILTTQSTTTQAMVTYPTATYTTATQPPVTQPSCVTPATTQAPNRCLNVNCKNGGTCREIAISPYTICICPPTFTGNECEGTLTTPQVTTQTTYQTVPQTTTQCAPVVPDRCSTISCMNGGTCTEIPTAPLVICVCNPGFTGSRCQTQLINPTQYPTPATTQAPSRCASVQCQNGGTCRDTDVAPYVICVCPSKFTGPRCETLLATQQTIYPTQPVTYAPTTIAPDMTNLCTVYANRNMNLCQNNGQCVFISAGRVVCVCPSNFEGDYCETPVYNKCTASNGYQQAHCHRKHGTCQPDGSCLCKAGWCGVSCDQQINPVTQAPSKCSTIQCLNGGSCIDISIEPFAICKCQPSYTGNRCETLVPTSPDQTTSQNVTTSITTVGPYGISSPTTASANRTECTAFIINLLNEGAFTARFRVQYKVDDVYQTIKVSDQLPFIGNRASVTLPYYATDIAVSLEKLGGSWTGIYRDTGINNVNYCTKCYKVWGDVVGAKWDYINC